MIEYDIWSNTDGKRTVEASNKKLVDDSDAPYGFSKHEVRVTAPSARDALKQFHALNKKPCDSQKKVYEWTVGSTTFTKWPNGSVSAASKSHI